MSVRWTLIWLTLFAISMAHVEAALVVHLRHLYYPADPVQIFPLNILSRDDLLLELAREFATLVMILSVAMLAVEGWLRRFAAFVLVFGWWDLWYYAWLEQMIGWPQGWLDWDVLFLIPWPWFGPWITPAFIALIFVVWGGWVLTRPATLTVTPLSAGIFCAGVVLALAAFLLPAWPLLPGGETAFQGFVPAEFPWLLYGIGVLAMSWGLLRVILRP